MPVAGVVILTEKEKTQDSLLELKDLDGITTYGVHKDTYIVAVFEAEEVRTLEEISNSVIDKIPGIIAVYPSYVNYED